MVQKRKRNYAEGKNFRRYFSSLTDGFGGVDSHILELVISLNECGFQTFGSCEGHVKHSEPVPYIAIELIPQGTPGSKKWTVRRKNIARLNKVLDMFYEGSNPGLEQIEIRTIPILDACNLVCNLKHYNAFVKFYMDFEKATANIENAPEPVIPREEQTLRKKELPMLWDEIARFAKFLKRNRKKILLLK